METYRIWYQMQGYVDVEAETELEALNEFGCLGSNELENNLFPGAEVTDVRVQ